MAHTTRHANFGNTAIAQVTFTSYTQGGEQFTLTEFGLTGALIDIWFISTTDANNRPPNATLVKYIGAGKVLLMQGTSPDQELPTTAVLDLTIFPIVQGS